MSNENKKKMEQLEAARNFGKALHDLRCAGIDPVYQKDEFTSRVVLLDRKTGVQIGEFASAEFLADLTGQTIDEFSLSDDYFGDLVKDDPTVTVTE